MALPLLKIEIKYEHDVVLARQRARQTAHLLGFDTQDQARIATAVSELARNVFQYAGSGKVELLLDESEPQNFQIRIIDHGPGIAKLQTILGGTYVSQTGMGLGIVGARRLMDHFHIESEPGKGTTVHIVKDFPAKIPKLTKKRLADIAEGLASHTPQDPFGEIQRQNQELLATLEEVHKQRAELAQLNRELEETNRGVVALYAELDERADYLKRASELKTQFLSNMTHEFRTPLNSILSISQMLLDRLDGSLTIEQEKQVKFIQAGAKSLAELVNDLLDLAKVEAGKVTVHPSQFKVEDMFGTLRGMLKPLIEHNSRVMLIFEKPVDFPLLETDEGKVSQILRNFISNGLKFTEKGEVRVMARVISKEEVLFSVSDTGIGIAAENQWRIFEEFTQIEGVHQKKSKGTGLGLPLSKKLAELLGGYVVVESIKGSGSTFSMTIPIRYKGPVVASFAPHESMEKHEFPDCRALIIDDVEADRYVLKRLLSEFNLEITEATGGIKGLDLAQEWKPDVIFLDLAMPDLSGWEVIERLKKNKELSAIPLIINTSKALTKKERASLEGKTAAILSKNHSSREMSQTRIRELLKRIDVTCGVKRKTHYV